MCDGKPRLKFSENSSKVTLPGLKKVLRYRNGDGLFNADAVMLEEELQVDHIFHPLFPDRHSSLQHCTGEPLLRTWMRNGEVVERLKSPQEAASYARERLAGLSAEHKRFENPHTYKVGISSKLMELRAKIFEELQRTIASGL